MRNEESYLTFDCAKKFNKLLLINHNNDNENNNNDNNNNNNNNKEHSENADTSMSVTFDLVV